MKCISPLIRLPICLIILLTLSSCGSSPSKPTSNTSRDASKGKSDACTNIAKLAASTMEARQDGISVTTLMQVNWEVMGKNPTPSKKSWHNVAELLILEAYDYPQYKTPTDKEKIIKEFQEMQYRSCLNA